MFWALVSILACERDEHVLVHRAVHPCGLELAKLSRGGSRSTTSFWSTTLSCWSFFRLVSHHYHHHHHHHHQVVFDVFKEVRRPQPPLVRDFVSAVLHPTLLGMPELNAVVPVDAAGATTAEGSAHGGGGGPAHPLEVGKRPLK